MPVSRLAAWALVAGSSLAWANSTPEVPGSPPPVETSPLDAPLFYQLLLGELELRTGDVGSAYGMLLDAARKTGDERLFRRATEIALQAQAGDQALAAVRAWRQTAPASLEAHRYEVQLLVALNRAPEAVEPLRAGLALVPLADRPAAIGTLLRLFGRTADRQAVVTVLERALQPYTTPVAAGAEPVPPAVAAASWTAIGSARLGAGDTAGAMAAVRTARTLAPDAEGPAFLAIDLMRSDPEAEALVTSFLAAEPPAAAVPRSAVRMLYARTLAVNQRYLEAVPQLEAVTRDAPQFVDAWLTLGALRLELKQPAEAEVALREYLNRTEVESPSDVEGVGVEGGDEEPQEQESPEVVLPGGNAAQRIAQAYLMLAQAAEQRRDFAAAESWLAKVDGSQALAVQTRRASLLAQQGRLEEGRALLRQLPERSPEDARAKLVADAQLLRDQKQWKTAFDVFAESNRRYPDDPDLLYEQAMMAEKLDRIDEMEKLLRRVIALQPDQAAAYNALGYTFADRKMRLDEARALIVKALELMPNDPYLIDSLGWVEYRAGNREEALKWLTQAHRQRPDTEIAAHLGEVLWVMGRHDEARRVWADAKARDGANDVLKETLARLKVDL